MSLRKRPSFAAQSLPHSPHNLVQLVSLLRENRYKSPCFATGRTQGLASRSFALTKRSSHQTLHTRFFGRLAPCRILPSFACLSEVTLSHFRIAQVVSSELLSRHPVFTKVETLLFRRSHPPRTSPPTQTMKIYLLDTSRFFTKTRNKEQTFFPWCVDP